MAAVHEDEQTSIESENKKTPQQGKKNPTKSKEEQKEVPVIDMKDFGQVDTNEKLN